MSYGFRNLLLVSLFFFSMVVEGYALIYEEHKTLNKIFKNFTSDTCRRTGL